MAGGSDSKFSYKSSNSFGIYSLKKCEQVKNDNYCFGKFVIFVGIVMLSFIISVISLLIYDVTTAYTVEPAPEERTTADDLKALKQTSYKPSTDINIIPENDLENRRISEHPNHRYTEMESKDKIYNNIRSDIYAESGWYPKPFQTNNYKNKYKVLDITPKIITSTDYPHINHIKFRKNKSKNIGSPVRLKGIYIKPDEDLEEEKEEEEAEDQKSDYSENYYNLKEINELMLSHLDENEEINSDLSKKKFGKYGRPFQLPKKKPESFKKNAINPISKNYHQTPKIQKTKGKPITILLDIYPMTDANQQSSKIPKSKFRFDNADQNGIIRRKRKYYPRSFDPEYSSSNNIPFKVDKGNRMIIKLNLFQKKKNAKRNFYFEDSDYSKNRKKAEERTFSLFSKHKKKKKKHSKKCSVVEVYAHESPYIAKWKGKDGQWIYTKHVDVKHYKNVDE